MQLEIIVVILAMIGIFFSVIFLFSSHQLKLFSENIPKESEIITKVSEKSQNTKLYDRNGILLYEFKDPDQDREYANIDEVPQNLISILLAAEDINFYKHEGVDIKAILRSLNIYYSSNGETVVGGSTITQQLVKNTVLTNERTLERKAKEIFISLLIESKYSKSEILEMYLNSISFGGNVIGIKTAARSYFSKDLMDLSFAEMVFLVGLIQLPGKSSPLFSSDQQLAWEIINLRKQYIYDQIRINYSIINSQNTDFLNIAELNLAEVEPVELDPDLGEIKAPHFVFYVKEILKNAPYNFSEKELGNGGYQIYTSLDYPLQQIAEQKLKEGVERYKHFGFENAALITLDPQTSEILVMVGSKDYFGQKTIDGAFDPFVNVALSERNLGSSLKPFIAYLAFKQQKYKPTSIISDSPIAFGTYKPKNYDGKYMGDITVKTALVESRNIPFVKITNSVGVGNILDLLDTIGYRNAKFRERYGLSLALGGFSSNLLEHTHAYTVFANKGKLNRLNQIKKIFNSTNEIVFQQKVELQAQLEEKYIIEVDNILAEYGLDGISGKTGTTDSNRDNYFIGYNTKFLTGIWIGNNNNKRMSPKAFGSTTALPIWNIYFKEVINKYPEYTQ